MTDARITTTSPSAIVSPVPGVQVPGRALIDGTANLVGGARLLYALPSAAYTSTVPASPNNVFSTEFITNQAVDINVTAITGGATSPSIQFIVERLGGDNVWYSCFAPNTLTFTTATQISIDLGQFSVTFSGPPASAAQHNVPTLWERFRWTFGGGTPPTSVTFSVSIIGR